METPGTDLQRRRAWILVGALTCASPSRRRRLLDRYGSLTAAAESALDAAGRSALLRASGGDDIFAACPETGSAEVKPILHDTETWIDGQIDRSARAGAHAVELSGAAFPPLLGTIPDPPALLHLRGDPWVLGRGGVAVVGARRATRYGLEVARILGRDLAAAGLVVVSGGARGIDSEAHRGALEAGGPTVAVLGSGLDVPYPRENAGLFDRIAERGAVVSEFPFGRTPEPYHFPVRNRLIAGLVLAVVVVEGREGSGSLITAGQALEMGREVFAVPGPVTSPLSGVPNRLIAEGAGAAIDALDVVSGLPGWGAEFADLSAVSAAAAGAAAAAEAGAPADAATRRILDALEAHEGRTLDAIAAATGIAPGDLLAALTELELAGRAASLPGGRFVRRL